MGVGGGGEFSGKILFESNKLEQKSKKKKSIHEYVVL